ncbi:MAG: acetylornithine aminotransferase [Clostridiales bacterium GWB2_37_7]|nr:MAG: acetylornithine aminotransferase [Clostridiales bacterium GWB2_37_7]
MSKDFVMNTYGRYDVVFEKGLGTKIYDINGKEYIDFVSGVAVNCLGHSHPAIVNALYEQSKKLIHISNYYWNTEHTLLAEKLIHHSDHSKVFFCNSGTEAVEGSLKLARKYGKQKADNKNVILYMNNSFHGRSMGALSVTGQPKYQQDFMPLIGGVKQIEFNNIEDLINNFDESVCGIIIEPIQGEGGIHVADLDFLQTARNLCNQYDAVLIFDEIQCGIGRLGNLFAYKEFGVIPDVIAMAKGLGGGFPIGAFLCNERTSIGLGQGDHGSTYGGNPLGSAVSLAVLKELIDGGIIDTVDQKSNYMKEQLYKLKEQYGMIEEIRGMGLLLGIVVEDAKSFVNACFDMGLLVVTAGPNVVRLLPPLNVSNADIDQALKIFEEVMKLSKSEFS